MHVIAGESEMESQAMEKLGMLAVMEGLQPNFDY